MRKIFAGILGMLESRKAMFCLTVLATSAYIAMKGHMDPSFAAVVSSLATVYTWTQHKVDLNDAQLPERGRL